MNGKFIVALIVLIAFFSTDLTLHGQTDEPAKQPNVGDSAPKKQPEDDLSRERVVALLHKQAFSKDPLIQQQAFRMLASNPDIHKELGDGVQLELVKAGLTSDSGLAEHTFAILEMSQIPDSDLLDVLLKAYDSKIESVNGPAFRLLERDRATYLPQMFDSINREPTGDHRVALKLIEQLGASASEATPFLIKRYKALKSKAAKDKIASVDYLDIVYALAEIGPAAKDGLFIALDAAEEDGIGDRKIYPIVGLACVERLLGSNGISFRRGEETEADMKYRKYAEKLMTSYDKDKDSRLSKAEIKEMKRPPTGADFNRDGVVTVVELTWSLSGKKVGQQKFSTTSTLRDEISRQRSFNGRK